MYILMSRNYDRLYDDQLVLFIMQKISSVPIRTILRPNSFSLFWRTKLQVHFYYSSGLLKEVFISRTIQYANCSKLIHELRIIKDIQ